MARDRETFIVFDFDHLWQGFNDDTSGVLCISGRDRSVLLSLLRFAAWPSRWVGNVGDNPNVDYPYNLLRENSRFEDLETALSWVEKLERKIIMAGCFDEMSAAIVAQGEAIKAGLMALAAKTGNCCGAGGQSGTGGAGPGSPPPLSEVETGQPGGHTGDPPDGFETWAEYDAYKCGVIKWILDTMIEDMQVTSTVQFGTGFSASTAAALIAAGLISPIPGDEVLIIAGLTVTASVLGVLSNLYSNIAEAINDARDDITCALFNGTTASSSQLEAQEVIDTALDGAMDSVSAGIAKRIAAAYLTGANINRLYVKDTTRTYPEADCADCNPPSLTFEQFGSPNNVDGVMTYLGSDRWRWESNSANFSGEWYFNFWCPDGLGNGIPFTMSDVQFTNFSDRADPFASEVGGDFDPGPHTYEYIGTPELETMLESAAWITTIYFASGSSFDFEATITAVP